MMRQIDPASPPLGTIFDHIGGEAVANTDQLSDVLAIAETGHGKRGQNQHRRGLPTYTLIVAATDRSGDRTGFVYDSATVRLLSSIGFRGGALFHSMLRGRLRPVGTADQADS